jgi:hypothetical protein
MKKIFLMAVIGMGISSYATEIKETKRETKKEAEVKTADCNKVYTDVRDASLEAGFTIGSAQQIGMAAYYACRNNQPKIATID